jgi:hypothetical protein
MLRDWTAVAALLIGAASWTAPGAVMAGSAVPGDTITASWSNVIVSGFSLNNPKVGDRLFANNAGTAVYSGLGTGTLTWGSDTGSFPQGTNYSSLQFVGSQIPSDYGSSFTIGTLTYTNGTSILDTLIFGATLSFYDGSTLLGSDQVTINTTANQFSGTGLTPAQLATDADYINICGPFSDICGQSIEAYENTESLDGSSYVVDLTGYIDGLVLTKVTSLSGPGVIGAEAPLGGAPEPSDYALMALGSAVLGAMARRQRSLRRLGSLPAF